MIPPCVPDASSSASTTLHVDFGKSAFFPLLKSKIGVGRALNSDKILESLRYLDEIRPAVYDAELRFPDTDYDSMKPYPIEGSGGEVQVHRNSFLDKMQSELRRRRIEAMYQVEGAPKQWEQTEKAHAPHKFPVPTDVKAAADAMGKWAQLYNDQPVTWCMWNEPSHNLTGRPDLASIRQIVDIYDAYASAMGPKGLFGLASFIPPNSKPKRQFGGRSYLEVAMDELRERLKANPQLPFDYLTVNNYGDDLSDHVDGARDALGDDFNTVPIIQAQFGVFEPGRWEKSGGTTLEAARMMGALATALQIPDLQTFTISGWMSHMIDLKGDEALRTATFRAVQCYARMPDRRTPVQGGLPDGVGAMASGDEHRGSVLVWNESEESQTIELDLSGMALSDPSHAELKVYHIDAKHGSPLEDSGSDFGATETERLRGSTRSLSKTVTVAGPGLVYLEVGAASQHPVLDRDGLSATLVRKHTYADRVVGSKESKPSKGPKGAKRAKRSTSVRGNAYGCYDAVRAVAYLGVEEDEGTALCGAEYSGLPQTLDMDVRAELPSQQAKSQEALFGVRVDYVLDHGVAKSVLWHGDIMNERRTKPLPWGRRGATADELVHAPQLDRARSDHATFPLALGAHAPSGWSASGARAIISFWMESTGSGSQARFLLG